MFGTVGHIRFDPANRAKLEQEMNDEAYLTVNGYRWRQVLFDENDPGHAVIIAVFDDRDTYFDNADAPDQDARYQRMRALLSEDPTWTDGEWSVAPSRKGPPQS